MTIDLSIYRAFALDLDGVITNTAAIHAAAWKQLIDFVTDAARMELR